MSAIDHIDKIEYCRGSENNAPDEILRGCLMIISSILLFLIGCLFLFHSKFKQHPYPFLGIACIAEACFYYSSLYYFFFCNEAFAWMGSFIVWFWNCLY